MLIVNGYDIKISKGDTLILKVHFNNANFPKMTKVLFTVRTYPNNPDHVILKEYTFDENGDIIIFIPSQETNIFPFEYSWDIRVLIPIEGQTEFEVVTPFVPAKFEVLKVVGNV